MNCPNCGKESVEDAKFCESCGAPLVSGVSEPAAPVPPAPASPFNAPEPSMPIGTNTAQSSVPQAPAQMQSGYAPYEPPAQPYGTQNGYAASNANTQQGYYTQPGSSQQNPYQNAYQAPYGQPVYQGAYDGAIYPMSDSDRTLRLINFILCLVSTITCALLIIPLAWMLPMTIISWGIYKGKKRNTTAFGVCTLLFVNLIGGIFFCARTKTNSGSTAAKYEQPEVQPQENGPQWAIFSYAAVAPTHSLASKHEDRPIRKKPHKGNSTARVLAFLQHHIAIHRTALSIGGKTRNFSRLAPFTRSGNKRIDFKLFEIMAIAPQTGFILPPKEVIACFKLRRIEPSRSELALRL